jgi:hypothetical protein
MWSIDVRNLVQNKFVICREYHIQPSEIDRMQMFEYEFLLEDIRAYNKQQEDQRKKDEQNQPGIPNVNSYMNSMKQQMPQMPKISMPKL